LKRSARALSLLALLLAAPPARSEAGAPDVGSRTAARPPTIEIRVLGDERALALVRIAAAELFSRLRVQLRVLDDAQAAPTEPGPVEPPLVLAYVDLRVPSAPLVDVDDGRTRQELMRRSLSDVSSLETGVEAALHVVLASVESMLQLAPSEPSAPPPAPRRPARAPARPRGGAGLDVGALIRLASLGGSRLTPGAGAALELRADAGSVRTDLGLWGALHTTTALDLDEGHSTLRPYALRLMPGLSASLSRDWQASAALGAGIDHFVLDARSAPSGGQARDHAVSDPVLSSQLGLRFPLAGAWFFSLLGTLDLDLAPARFSVDRAATREVLFALPRWRGGVMLIASFSPTSVQRFHNRSERP